jgi:hypothetical protein
LKRARRKRRTRRRRNLDGSSRIRAIFGGQSRGQRMAGNGWTDKTSDKKRKGRQNQTNTTSKEQKSREGGRENKKKSSLSANFRISFSHLDFVDRFAAKVTWDVFVDGHRQGVVDAAVRLGRGVGQQGHRRLLQGQDDQQERLGHLQADHICFFVVGVILLLFSQLLFIFA